MSTVKSLTSVNPNVKQPSTNILDNRFCRWSIGRADSVGRLAVCITAFAVQTIKVIGKSLLVGLSLNAGKYAEGLEEFSSEGLKCDVTFLGVLGYKCAKAFKDIILAPDKGYPSTPIAAFNATKHVLGGHYHMTKEGKAYYIKEVLQQEQANKKPVSTSDSKKPIREQVREKLEKSRQQSKENVRLYEKAVNLHCSKIWKCGTKK